MLTFHLVNILGNQSFTYFAGLYLSKLEERPLNLDLTGIAADANYRKSSILDLDFSLEGFSQPIYFSPKKKSDLLIFRARKSHKVCKIAPCGSKYSRQYRSLTYGYDVNLDTLKGVTTVWGYFQTYRYLKALIDKGIKINFKIKNPSPWYIQMELDAQKSSPILIHMRRGDYVEYKDNLGVLTLDYFLTATRTSVEKTSVTRKIVPSLKKIWIFSDNFSDADELKIRLNRIFPGLDARVITGLSDSQATASELLLLMIQASVLIKSNSSFSWWGAKISEERKIIFAPSPYFKNFSGEHLHHVPDKWKKVASSFY